MPIEVENFKDSFDMVFGTDDKTIDLFDNPYIRFNVYELDESWKIHLS